VEVTEGLSVASIVFKYTKVEQVKSISLGSNSFWSSFWMWLCEAKQGGALSLKGARHPQFVDEEFA